MLMLIFAMIFKYGAAIIGFGAECWTRCRSGGGAVLARAAKFFVPRTRRHFRDVLAALAVAGVLGAALLVMGHDIGAPLAAASVVLGIAWTVARGWRSDRRETKRWMEEQRAEGPALHKGLVNAPVTEAGRQGAWWCCAWWRGAGCGDHWRHIQGRFESSA